MEIDVTAVIPDDWQGRRQNDPLLTARCPETGQLGIAISSSSMAVGSRCPWLLPGVGAVSSQNITLPSLGPQIQRDRGGASVEQAMKQALAEDRFREYRRRGD